MNLEKANEIMGIFNECVDDIRKKKDEFDKKRLHDRKAGLVHEGLRYAYIQLTETHGKLEKALLEDLGK